jgi:hypothetical protein
VPDSEQGKSETRRRPDERHQQSKDRAAHVGARGKKAPTLEGLARELPSQDDLIHYTAYVVAESDRGAAVMASARVEQALEDAIRAHLAEPGDGAADTWFKGPNAPFQSFSAKIALGRAIGIYGAKLERSLTLVRKIRNAFAHRMLPLDFSNPAVAAACTKLAPSANPDVLPRIAFSGACLGFADMLRSEALSPHRKDHPPRIK